MPTIVVCAWHKERPRGRFRLLGIRLRPWLRFQTSHGVCQRCSERFASSWRADRRRRESIAYASYGRNEP